MEIKLTDYQVVKLQELTAVRDKVATDLEELVTFIMDANGKELTDGKMNIDFDTKTLSFAENGQKKRKK